MMGHLYLSLLFIIHLTLLFTFGVCQHNRQRRSLTNKVTGVYASCSRNDLKATVKTAENFTGSIYARGYPTECTAKGHGSTSTELTVSPQECGVKILKEDNGSHTFKMLIYVQFDPWVQQVSDEQVSITCAIDKSRDLLITGISSINVHDDQEVLNVDEDFLKRERTPKLNTFSLSDLYPSNILNLPSKLQQMVANHQKNSNKKHKITSTTPANDFSPETVETEENTEDNTEDMSSTMSSTSVSSLEKTSTAVAGDSKSTTTEKEVNYKMVSTESKPKLPLQVLSSFLSITGNDDEAVPYKGIYKAPMKEENEKELNLQPINFFGEWKPMLPPDVEPEKLEKWKTLLGTGGNDEMVSCWLDIVKGNSPFGKAVKEELFVGETATLVVRVRRQTGIDTRVTSCKAHDGSGINVQELVDMNGCSVDREIMPEFKTKVMTNTNEEISYAPFKAFKFPDHDNLHLKCTVEICMGHCEKKRCGRIRHKRQSGSFFLIKDEEDEERIFGHKDDTRTSKQYVPNIVTTTTKKPIWPDLTSNKAFLSRKKTPQLKLTTGKTKSKNGKVVDNVEVFNSVEVRAPELEERPQIRNDYQRAEKPKSIKSTLEDEDVFCITSAKLVATFGILLAIFVLALLVALYWCVKDKLHRMKIKRNNVARTIHNPRFGTIPHNMFPGVVDYAKYPRAYHRFQH